MVAGLLKDGTFDGPRAVLLWFYHHAVVVFLVWIVGALVIDVLLRKRTARRGVLHPDDATSVISGIAFIAFKTVCSKLILFSMSVWVYENLAPIHLSLADTWVWVAVFIVRDFVYYWVHRTEHVTRVLWASHMVHHSPRTINYWTALRTPWMEEIYKPFIALWMPLVGFNPAAVIALDVVIALHGQLIHSETRQFPAWMNKYFVTPSMHRVHHASNPEYLDCNFSAIFCVWDRMFGTYRVESGTLQYGLAGGHNEAATRLLMAGGYPTLWEGMRARRSLRSKFRYAFDAPVSVDVASGRA